MPNVSRPTPLPPAPGARSAAFLFLALGALALYLATLSRWYSADTLLFAVDIELDGQGWSLDPYHLALNPLCGLAIALARAAGLRGIDGLEVMNAIAGALSVALLFLLAARLGVGVRAAVLASIGFAVSGATWLLSTEGEGVTPGLAAQLAVLSLLLPLGAGEPRSPWRAMRIGAAIGAAALLYLNNAALLAVAALVLWQGRAQSRRWWRSLLVVVAGFAVVLLPAMMALAIQQFPQGVSEGDLRFYLGGDLYGGVSWQNVPRAVYGFLRSLVLFPNLGINDETSVLLESASVLVRLSWAALYAAVALFAAVPLLWSVRAGAAIDPLRRRRLWLWALLYAGFGLWWVPSDISFWVPLTAGWWVAVALLLSSGDLSPRVVAVGVALLFAINGAGLIWPHHDASRNRPLQTALAIGARIEPADRLLTSPALAAFARYFAGATSRSIHNDASFRRELAQARRDTAASGGRILVADLELTPARLDGARAVEAFEAEGAPVLELR